MNRSQGSNEGQQRDDSNDSREAESAEDQRPNQPPSPPWIDPEPEELLAEAELFLQSGMRLKDIEEMLRRGDTSDISHGAEDDDGESTEQQGTEGEDD